MTERKRASTANFNGRDKTLSRPVTNADKFTLLFDKDWRQTKSRIRTKADDDRSYDISRSWDALSDNPQSFSRLEAINLPIQPTKPVTLLGSAIVELEPKTGLDVLNCFQEKKTLSTIPLTREQLDVGMKPDLKGQVPMMQQAKDENAIILLESLPTFQNMNMSGPQFKKVEIPQYMIEAGPNCDQRLLTPAQRREILEIEKRKNLADSYVRVATSQRCSLRKQMAGQQFYRGILGVDSNENDESEIYGERSKKYHADKDYKAQIRLERTGQLAIKNSSMGTNGNILCPETIAARVKMEPFYQRKGGIAHALSFEETHNRLFCRRAEKPPPVTRTQKIRDLENAGRDYDFVAHTTIEHWPSKPFDRLYKKTELHPSNHTGQLSFSHAGSI